MSKLDEIIERLARIETQIAEREKNYSSHNERLLNLERTVNGNGKIGLSEEIRALKGKWTAVTVTASVVLSAAVQKILGTVFR